ncbi:hypothetical protein F1559_001893 [Cyanidiococcus yangmingshanensis]|uniref:Uncharacterized protein n=1 Tax=Cyanidiococcus yangmingshanensis TaxID=2690220 RepID=A0A7J7IE08_9RHOD|nr:hypothetical protein F1559_001893 [Cyanidiococcus yangmingshanensis]
MTRKERSETSMHCRAEHDPDSVFVTEPEDECLTDWRPRFYGRIRDSEMAMIAGAQQCPSFWDRADDHGCLDEAVAGTGPREQPCTCKTFSGVAGAPTGKQLVQSDQSQVLPSDSKRIGRPPRNPFTRSLRWLLRQPSTASRQRHAIEPSQPRTPSGESATYAGHRVDYFSIIEVGGIQTEVVVIPTSRLGVTNKPIWSGRGLSPNHKTLSVSSMDSSSTVVVVEEPQPPSLSTLTSSRSDWLTNRERTTTTIKRTGDMLGEATEKDPWFRRIVSETARETDSDPNTWTERLVVDERHQHQSRSPTSTPRTVRTREHRKVSIGYPSQLESDQGNQIDAAWTESDGSGTLPVSIPSPNQVRRRQCQVVFFPGNPGCIELYESFLLNCASVLAHAAHPNYEFIVHGVGLAGHDLRGLNRPGRFFDLADQTRHKLAYIREHLHWRDGSNDDALILVGHSTGAHIICRLLEEDPVLAQRAQVILLTPAIADSCGRYSNSFPSAGVYFSARGSSGCRRTGQHDPPYRSGTHGGRPGGRVLGPSGDANDCPTNS